MSFGFSPIMPGVVSDVKAHDRTVEANQKAASAQGLTGDDKESEAASNERDADGRQAWRWNQRRGKKDGGEHEHKVPDLAGKTGATLDLDG
ncbi:hypothetical protein FACS189454_09940 [Planctomycetales bacterium]|nr:hypothetical protein FACS189454_09940 [Planctomycetales bacterium]